MKIQIGEILMGRVNQTTPIGNKTLKYLLPCLKKYGKEFEQLYAQTFKVAVGLGDMLFEETTGNRFEQHIFILIDTRKNRQGFIKFHEWVQDFGYYEDDYVYGDIKQSPLHMFVFKLPEECVQSFEKFTKGKYSEMYSLEEVDQLFNNHPEAKKVLVKDNRYKISFVDKLNREFNTDILPVEYDGELDLPPRTQEEYFE